MTETIEKNLAACLVLNPTSLPRITHLVNAEYFSHATWKAIYEATAELTLKGSDPDVWQIAIAASQIVGKEVGPEDLAKMIEGVNAHETIFYAEQLRKAVLKKAAEKVCTDTLFALAEKDPLEALSEMNARILASVESGTLSNIHISSALTPALDVTWKAMTSQGPVGIHSGLKSLDKLTGGWMPGDQVILAARPGMGKTTFSVNMALKAAESGTRVLYISLEMSRTSIVHLFQSVITGIEMDRIRSGRIAQSNYAELSKAADDLKKLPLWISEGPRTLHQLMDFVRTQNLKHGVDLLVLDYIQLVRVPNVAKRHEQIEEVSKGLKDLTSENDVGCANIILSQINREGAKAGKRPTLADLKGSGAIEEDATLVLALDRESYYDPNMNRDESDVLILKSRYGETGSIKVVYKNRKYSLREEIDLEEEIEW